MDIFSESPMSFKINMKSPLASMLKSSISDKLVHFLGDCTDDVLAVTLSLSLSLSLYIYIYVCMYICVCVCERCDFRSLFT
ncbi:hypothetical protein RHMOL_Rhmol03G0064000 [Rhododendron molle]|uniref:Uncharacterized protein n=3 Tax=Rhododendron molle TaxID=49168 RepID=A0ACC0PAY6_RHOML|nr:hypothetical protein RHMOL_Rhmol03G0064000 [Rhododendron molle]KAI8562806.1 hypothetical protein RHMOL_Rhmol03G0064000 [Rhododendron molle]KAI8562808.1 hypothetical protein RHMOL_Rhmol03G0064000 [Rhododendron molle]